MTLSSAYLAKAYERLAHERWHFNHGAHVYKNFLSYRILVDLRSTVY